MIWIKVTMASAKRGVGLLLRPYYFIKYRGCLLRVSKFRISYVSVLSKHLITRAWE